MRKVDAVKHFGSEAAVAAALEISRAAVNKWGEVVPLESATALETLTHGQISVDRALYPAIARADREVA